MKKLKSLEKKVRRITGFKVGMAGLAGLLFLMGSAGWPADLAKPKHGIVLTVSGKIGNTNAPGRALFDIEGLEALGLTTYTTFDPYEKRRVEYTGVLMSRLLEALEANSGVERVRIVALDKYKVTLRVEDIRRWPILLATRMEGQRLSVVKKGPTKIVFPYDDHPEIDHAKYDSLWIWQVKTMTAE